MNHFKMIKEQSLFLNLFCFILHFFEKTFIPACNKNVLIKYYFSQMLHKSGLTSLFPVAGAFHAAMPRGNSCLQVGKITKGTHQQINEKCGCRHIFGQKLQKTSNKHSVTTTVQDLCSSQLRTMSKPSCNHLCVLVISIYMSHTDKHRQDRKCK